MQDQKRILLCVTGKTPQIITETLYVLILERRERVDEIRVITTLEGRNEIVKRLLDPTSGKFFEFCRDYGVDPVGIKLDETSVSLLHGQDGSMLEDIRSLEENADAANQICEIVRALTEEPNVHIHASAAGGRKTMGIYLTAAMQLFGRTLDQLSHVLVSEDFETHPHFFYKPPTERRLEKKDRQGNLIKMLSTDDAKVELADIPFIRLRGVMSGWLGEGNHSYSHLVRLAQEDLDLLESAHVLRLDTRKRAAIIANRNVRLTEREFFIYTLFARLRCQGGGENGFVSLDEMTVENIDAAFRQITAARGVERGLEDYILVARFDFLGKLAEQVASQDYEERERFKDTFLQVIAKIKKKFEERRLPARYLIVTRGHRGSLLYGLEIAPERIEWV
jgi:CRISPR-associated protein (TIGR02584 family)